MKEIPLTQGAVALVDDDDYESVAAHKWMVVKRGNMQHAMRSTGARKDRHTVYMHRLIAAAPTGLDVDHINGNGLDNRRANLRLCTRAENLLNKQRRRDSTARFKGIYFFAQRNRWRARIKAHGETVNLGYFDTDVEAARAYDRAARELHGEFARLNFPDTK